VTQFLTSDGSDAGDLVEIRRSFVQGGVAIPHPAASNIAGAANLSSITDGFCRAKAAAYGDNDNFEAFGGLRRMGQVMDRGMVLVLSQWLDYEAHMLWLDSTYPANATAGAPGAARGSCATSSGDPADIIAQNPHATVKWSKISLGPIGFTEARLRRERELGRAAAAVAA
jgi:cellulose 1,4-beta-cellobiosidase